MPTIQFRTDEATKSECSAIFNQLGLSMTDAINIFLRQAILHGGLPFEVKVPQYNTTTLATPDDDAEFGAISAKIAALETKYGTTPNAKLRASIEELHAGGGIEFSSARDALAYLNDDSDD